MPIPVDQLRRLDLGLLLHFVVLVEEKTVVRAAARLGLSQPAVTRALLRLREVFDDELVVRTKLGYRTTARGQELLAKLATLLPQLEDVIAGTPFDAARTVTTFRITAADSLCYFYAPLLVETRQAAPNISFVFETYAEDRYGDLERNARDLVLDAHYKTLRGGLRTEALFDEEFVCVVAKGASCGSKMNLRQYLAAKHISINLFEDTQAIPDIALARHGLKRQCAFRVPYFGVGLAMVAMSELVVTLPLSLAAMLIDRKTTRLVEPPKELAGYSYGMIWHHRQEADARHIWLRQTLRSVTKDFVDLLDRKHRRSSALSNRPATPGRSKPKDEIR